jgi:hypothetical protein
MALKITATGPLADGENLVTINGVVPGNPFGVRYLCVRVVGGEILMFYQYDDTNELTTQVLVHLFPTDDDLPANEAWLDTILMPTDGAAVSDFVGDFCAVNIEAVGLPTTPVVMAPPTVQSGNAGDWYDPTTGRYTPPAGRYFLHATVTAALSTGSTGIQVNLRKNGEAISAPGGQVTGGGTNFADPANVATVDANGTDVFDFTCFASGGASSSLIQFLAFPLASLAEPQATVVRHVSARAAM